MGKKLKVHDEVPGELPVTEGEGIAVETTAAEPWMEPAATPVAEPLPEPVKQPEPDNALIAIARRAYPDAKSLVVVAEGETQFVVEVDGAPRKLAKEG